MSPIGDMDVNGDLVSGTAPKWHQPHPEPGETCERCNRKVPHPRKESSPTSKTFAYRVPLDEAEAHADVLDQAQRFVGCAEQPFSSFKVVALALALVLQDESLKGFATRAAA